ncbi:hypothetical protein BD777DRAFT_32794 [Yarrowia lipolytica]|nr:hypothetical protein BD777DRAFT_32794 [Yarrowia lipolytica]
MTDAIPMVKRAMQQLTSPRHTPTIKSERTPEPPTSHTMMPESEPVSPTEAISAKSRATDESKEPVSPKRCNKSQTPERYTYQSQRSQGHRAEASQMPLRARATTSQLPIRARARARVTQDVAVEMCIGRRQLNLLARGCKLTEPII